MNKNELLKKFGKNVKIERVKKDLTQEQLARINAIDADDALVQMQEAQVQLV